MPKKSLSRDRRLISSEPHELSYAGRKLGKGGKAAVSKAKKTLGHTTARGKVMKRAASLTRGKKK